MVKSKAYIPLRRKNICVGSSHWLKPPTRNFALGVPTCWYLKMLKFVLPPTQILKFALPPMRNPNARQWNIGCAGCQMQNSYVGHVHLFFHVSISFALGHVFLVENGLKRNLFTTENDDVIGMVFLTTHQGHPP